MKTKITFILIVLVITIMLAKAGNTRADTWTQKADMPTARNFVHTNVVNGKIYAIGAIQPVSRLTTVEEYDPVTDTWTAKAPMPTQRTFIATGVVDGKIYVMGGDPYWNAEPTLDIVEAYDPVTDTWTRKADMPVPRRGMGACVVNGKIYAIGGAYSQSGREVSTVEVYDPATDTWTRKADMPTARSLPNVCVVNGKIYVIGGQTKNGPPAAFPSVEVYDPASDIWTRKGDMPWPRTGAGSIVVHGKIYCFGGRAINYGAVLSTVLQYDPAIDVWTDKGDMPSINAFMGVSTMGGKIYIIGGSTSISISDMLSTVWEYDTGFRIPPDFNGDGIVNSADVRIMVDHWHTDNALYDIAPPWGDGIVDVQDLVFLSEHLFEQVFDSTLVAHWPLDETEGVTARENVNGIDDFVMGGALWQPAEGMIGGALELDGIDDCIISSTGINLAERPFSVIAWIKSDTPGQVIISQPGGVNWLMTDSEGNLMTELTGSGRSATQLLSQAFITDEQWHRIGFVWDGSKRMLYVDGTLVAEDIQDGLGSFGSGLYIGAGNNYASDIRNKDLKERCNRESR
jgi:N-acetylneuraminic acid mutarotase